MQEPVTARSPIGAGRIGFAVEVAVSWADRDLILKRRLYAAAGTPTYRVADAVRRVTHMSDRPVDDG